MSNDVLLSSDDIEQMCREAYNHFSRTYSDGKLTWDRLPEDDRQVITDITVKVVHRLERQFLEIAPQPHEHQFSLQMEDWHAPGSNRFLMRFCPLCGLAHVLTYQQEEHIFYWIPVVEKTL